MDGNHSIFRRTVMAEHGRIQNDELKKQIKIFRRGGSRRARMRWSTVLPQTSQYIITETYHDPKTQDSNCLPNRSSNFRGSII